MTSAADEEGEIFAPPTLKNKVTVSNTGVDMTVLEKAENIMANLKDSYLEWVEDDFKRLNEAFKALVADPENKEKAKAVFNIVHDMKGQGGSFGYDLITIVGNNLCRFIEKREKMTPKDIEIIQIHINSMRLIISERITKDGGEKGKAMLRGLDAVLAKNIS